MTAVQLVVLLVLDEGASGDDECSYMKLRLSMIKQTAVLSLCRGICEQWFVSEKIVLFDPCDTAGMRGINSDPQLAVDIVLRCSFIRQCVLRRTTQRRRRTRC